MKVLHRAPPGSLFPLLIALVALFLLYPLMIELGGMQYFRFGFVLVLALAAYSVGRSRKHLWTAILLGVPAAVGQLVVYARPEGRTPLVALVIAFVFLAYTTVVVFCSVVRAGRVTADKIAGAVSVYLLLGLLWALLYALVSMLDPGAFRLPPGLVLEPGTSGGEYAFIYYSFVTLTTLGYGEISPTSHWSQAFAWMEAVTGQLFLAILIARLVGLHLADGARQE